MDEENDVKFSEKIAVNLKRKIFVNRFLLFILILVVLALFAFFTILLTKVHLVEYDLTENKVYTLSQESKDALKDIQNPVTIYAYGFEGSNNQMENFLRQYQKASDKISYKMISDETDPNIVKQNDLTYGYVVLIFESGENSKIVDAKHDLSTYNNITGESLDITEQVITNTILDFQLEKKPKIYFTTGHNEMAIDDEIIFLNSFLHNESFDTEAVDLVALSAIPEDCDCLAIMSPTEDLFEKEADMILAYLENGGSILVTQDTVGDPKPLPNFNRILEFYGAGYSNGYILELNEYFNINENTPWIFIPQVNLDDSITKEIASESRVFTTFACRILNDLGVMNNNNVTYTSLLKTTENAVFVSDVKSELTNDVVSNSEYGTFDIAGRYVKKLGVNDDNTDKTSQMVFITCGQMVSNGVYLNDVNPQTPIVGLVSNRDLVINSLAELSDKGAGLKIRKNMSSSTYTPTPEQNRIVLLVIFGVPILIMIIGFIVWRHRNKRK